MALATGVLYSASLNLDWLLRLLRKWRITQRTGNSIWNDAFQDILSLFVLVQLSGGRSVVDFLCYYPYEQEDISLFLEYAAWIVDEEGTQFQIDGPGILLTKKSGIESVTFLNTGKNEPRGKS
jgi:hypothetical protein